MSSSSGSGYDGDDQAQHAGPYAHQQHRYPHQQQRQSWSHHSQNDSQLTEQIRAARNAEFAASQEQRRRSLESLSNAWPLRSPTERERSQHYHPYSTLPRLLYHSTESNSSPNSHANAPRYDTNTPTFPGSSAARGDDSQQQEPQRDQQYWSSSRPALPPLGPRDSSRESNFSWWPPNHNTILNKANSGRSSPPLSLHSSHLYIHGQQQHYNDQGYRNKTNPRPAPLQRFDRQEEGEGGRGGGEVVDREDYYARQRSTSFTLPPLTRLQSHPKSDQGSPPHH
ncbi:hypothetical protein CBS101457_004678 [Exobasidium rhododendri]|nr:hypothetical protein CBS101457_004678 [Exobasidium rhododendri]